MADAVITKHYNGEAQVKFNPGNHSYYVNDEVGFEFKGKHYTYKNKRAGGATSVTGVMDKGKGLMMWPMWEMNKYLRKYFNETTIADIFESQKNLDDILKDARDAHVKKSDLGKSVGTDAHQYAEDYLNALQAFQQGKTKEFVAPPVPKVEDIKEILKRRYIEIIKTLKPQNIEEFQKLPKLITQDIEIQAAMWEEATMLVRSINALRGWFEAHEIEVIGCEQNTYSRTAASKYLDEPTPQCGYYDATLKITCSAKCGHCYTNKLGEPTQETFTATYITDFKTTNTSSEFSMGIYPEYLPQCGVYDLGFTEEFPEIKVDGHLILNASKQDGSFTPFFSFERERNRDWACHLIAVKEAKWAGTNEVKEAGKAHEEHLKRQAEEAKKAAK